MFFIASLASQVCAAHAWGAQLLQRAGEKMVSYETSMKCKKYLHKMCFLCCFLLFAGKKYLQKRFLGLLEIFYLFSLVLVQLWDFRFPSIANCPVTKSLSYQGLIRHLGYAQSQSATRQKRRSFCWLTFTLGVVPLKYRMFFVKPLELSHSNRLVTTQAAAHTAAMAAFDWAGSRRCLVMEVVGF